MTLKDISVVIPTRNCRHLIEPFGAHLQEWLAEVGEIIVVDSESTDGTLELLQATLPAAHARFMSRPPGLYASWNHGIQLCTLPLIYVATAGDLISAADLAFLAATAGSTGADVVTCPPEFRDESGATIEGPKWPIHHLLEQFPNADLVELSGTELAAFALTHCRPPLRYHGWVGSAASSIYRASALQDAPFPEDAGHSGDTLWGVRQSRHVRAVFGRQKRGTFITHTTTRTLSTEEQSRIFRIFHTACVETMEWLLTQDGAFNNPMGKCYLRQTCLDQTHTLGLIASLTDQQGALTSEMQKKEEYKSRCAQLNEKLGDLRRDIEGHKNTMRRIESKVPRWVLKLFGARQAR